MALNLIMLGPPGAGKGTQAERFAASRGIPKISTGDMLRQAVQEGTEIGLRAKATIARGDLVQDDVIIAIVRERLTRDDCREGFVLDGFPRTVAQAEALDQMLDKMIVVRDPLIIVEIVVEEAELVRRLSTRMVCDKCGATAHGFGADVERRTSCRNCGGRLVQRSDDDDEVVRERLKVYRLQTKPLVDYYQVRPTFRTVDGLQPPDHVAADLASAIASAAEGVAR